MTRFVNNLLIGALVCAIAMAALAPAAMASGPQPGATPAKAVPITLHGSFAVPQGWGFGANNITQPGPPITVDQGDVVTFTLFAADDDQHNLVIDLNSNNVQDQGEPASIVFNNATTSVTFVYTANTAGTFQYICGIHGGNAMRGSFTVRATGGTPPTDNTLLIIGGVVVLVVIVAAVGAAMMMRRKKP